MLQHYTFIWYWGRKLVLQAQNHLSAWHDLQSPGVGAVVYQKWNFRALCMHSIVEPPFRNFGSATDRDKRGMCPPLPHPFLTAHVYKVYGGWSKIGALPPPDKVDGIANNIWLYLTTEIQTYLTKPFQFPNMIRSIVQHFCGRGQIFYTSSLCPPFFGSASGYDTIPVSITTTVQYYGMELHSYLLSP